MKIFHLTLVLLFVGCTSQLSSTDRLKRLEEKAFAEPEVLDTSVARQLVEAYQTCANEYPEHQDRPEWLFKAGEVALNNNKRLEAINQFIQVVKEYPSHPVAPQALFMLGMTLDDLGNHEQATRAYQDFLTNYPNHPLAEDVQRLQAYSITNTDDLALVKEWLKKDSLATQKP